MIVCVIEGTPWQRKKKPRNTTTDKRVPVSVGRQGQKRQARQGRNARGRARPAVRAPCAARASLSPRSRKAKRSGKAITEKDLTLFTRQLATMMKAGVPLLQSFDIVGKGHSNPSVAKLLQRHQDRRRDRHQPETGVPQISAVFRRPVLQPGRRGRGGRYPGNAARPPGDLQGKNPRHQEQDQIRAVLPDRHHRGRLHHHRRDHDFRDPGVQGGVHQLRRRPARADAGRDGDFGFLRQVLVGSSSAFIGGGCRFLLRLEALQEDADASWTYCCSSCRSSAT